jgi:addiction module RelE/StbE family toxin
MYVRWTRAAYSDLENIADYLFDKAPEHAPRLVRELYNAPLSLEKFPNRGRKGRKPGTRELVLSSLPYIVVYEVRGESLFVVRILHSAQDWRG